MKKKLGRSFGSYKYGEPIKRVEMKFPVSKVKELKAFLKSVMKQWIVKRK